MQKRLQTKVSLYQNIIYGLPGLPLAMLGVPLFVYLPSYYSQNLGLSLTAVGFALLLARILDVITDPIIGLLNDRYPLSLSLSWRRKSYMLLGLPLLLLGLHFLLRPNENVTIFYLFLWSFITYFAWTLINIPWLALGAEMSEDYHEKSKLVSSREIFAVFGTVLVISLPFILGSELNLKITLDNLAWILTFLLPLTLIPLIWKLVSISDSPVNEETHQKTGQKFEASKTNNTSDQQNSSNYKKLLSIVKYPAIRQLLPSYFINSLANALPATLFILFVTHVIQTPERVGILLISYFLSAIVGIPIWLTLAKKTDKHKCWCIALAGSILSFIWVPFLNIGDFYTFLIICIASGIFLGADVVMPASIQADISQKMANDSFISSKTNNEDSLEQNKQKNNSTALLFGLWGLLTKLALALAIGIAFPLLDLAGLQTDVINPVSNEIVTLTLIVLYALLPIILKIWVLLRMWHFPFDKHYFFIELSTSEKKSQKRSLI